MSAISKVIEVITDRGLRIIKLLRSGENDTINSYMLSSFGDDFNVPKGYKALYIRTQNSDEPVCIGFVNKVIADTLNSGDRQLFSTNSAGDTIAAFIKFLNDGIIHINGDADFAVGFNNLKSGFDEAISDLNGSIAELNKIINALNTWVPVVNDGGAALKALITANPPAVVVDSTASVDSSKKDNVKIE